MCWNFSSEISIGLYRDDGLAAINQTPQRIEKIKKDICQIFAQNNLRITIEANKKIVNFLDVTLDLTTGRFKPYLKPATTPLYVHSKSNHPPNIIRNIPEAINKRLSEISSDEDAFNEAAPPYQEALRTSGYAYNLKFKPETQKPPNQKKRRRNIIWFNPPFNKNAQTDIGRMFINLIDKCFPTGHKLKKIFNRNTIKVGLTATDFKTRWRNHQMSFKHEKRRNDTELSKHLWKLKKKKEDYTISWNILAKARAYTNATKRCNLCITEKFFILSNPQMATVNKRNELISNCRHRRKYILKYC